MVVINKIYLGSSLLGWKAYIQFIIIILVHTINVQIIGHLLLYWHIILKATKNHTKDTQFPKQVAFWFIATYVSSPVIQHNVIEHTHTYPSQMKPQKALQKHSQWYQSQNSLRNSYYFLQSTQLTVPYIKSIKKVRFIAVKVFTIFKVQLA